MLPRKPETTLNKAMQTARALLVRLGHLWIYCGATNPLVTIQNVDSGSGAGKTILRIFEGRAIGAVRPPPADGDQRQDAQRLRAYIPNSSSNAKPPQLKLTRLNITFGCNCWSWLPHTHWLRAPTSTSGAMRGSVRRHDDLDG
jgi:hypothetical protein